ncbi:diaminopimelate decarboxylase [Clostridium tertium]|jgi:diaminopimelate decarboxylase|uniref:Diaminopimelate decarboxylase n=1 Tax=Clostridium tertium TaxID=1559 RepID=A0A9X4B276_9CLOT|nr:MULTISPECIES: diaminopimelate decarboxylase [Clostridium]EEH99587.1 diaminopimelate decarboxylase [Clostridium sp. 7_2_43FAA]MBS6502625.1 diaminopimelate decarboxylase [Clostridium sp.]MBU6136890.1 diaminopimelate decarboxylase [Clostridium tertium]MDB1941019.1 diaminopimelate decarboxylase [Clostridium tertium]MDB1949114.1 diaminopimelate decarboxylase [Clostridium tertium]
MILFGASKIEGNNLIIGGIKAKDLAKDYGTPLYVMDEQLLIDNCRDYVKYFKVNSENNRVAFAGKAFLTLEMCRLIDREGLYLDVVSGGELYTAYKANFPMEKIYFHGNNKTLEEIEFGIKLGVGRFIVDNLWEMIKINEISEKYNKVQKVYLRLTPGIEAHTHEYIKTGQIDSKFGFAPVGNIIMDAIKKALELENIELVGLHCHIGSQIFETEPFADAAEVMINFINNIRQETGHMIEELDLGGGFGIYYSEGDKPKETKEYCDIILNRVNEVCNKLSLKKPILTIEPGRSIVANAGTTLYTIGSIKEIPGVRKYLAIDGGMTDNIRPALYEAKYEALIANKASGNIESKVTVAGKCCESGDILLQDINLQEAESGDILAVLSTGAYGFSMSSGYNKNLRPAVVFVRNGEAKVVCKRQSYEELLINEI